ncbi:rhamnan synthesis F family protein [Sphingomonas sp. BLCC-B65]|nr:rhamnan synthesis F family protein [Sphingomonas sp. BLCC-B65]
MSADTRDPLTATPAPRRAVVYATACRKGRVHDYALYALERLRHEAEILVVVLDGASDDLSRARVAAVADEVVLCDDPTATASAFADGIARVGDRLDDVDELVLTDDSWFGPVTPLADVFARMASRPADYWTMTDVDRAPRDLEGVRPPEWIVLRPAVLSSPFWRRRAGVPGVDGVSATAAWADELRAAGFSGDVAFPSARRRADGEQEGVVFSPAARLAAGCPLLARSVFGAPPEDLARHGVIGRELLVQAARAGYPVDLVWPALVTSVAPRVLSTNAALFEVLGHGGEGYDETRPMRILVAMHVYYPDRAPELMAYAQRLPAGFDVIVTTPDEERAGRIRQVLGVTEGAAQVEVRVVDSNDGRDQSAFLIGCREELRADRYDLVVKLHSKASPQDDPGVARHFRDQLLENLLPSRGYAAELVALFQRERTLGIVHPPMVHLGYPTMGHAWWANRDGAARLCATLGIDVPLDEGSPIAPYGSMFVARPDALRPLVDHAWHYADFGGAEAYVDGGLAHVLERLPVLAAAERGYHARAVATPAYTAISHTAIEYRLDALSSSLPPDGGEAIAYLRSVGPVGSGRWRDFARMYLRRHHPRAAARLRRWGMPV